MTRNREHSLFVTFPALVKLRLTLAVVMSSVTGYYLCQGSTDVRLIFLALGVFLLASGSAILNQYTERNSDALMSRTMNRPLPSGKVSEKEALILAGILFPSGSILLLANGLMPMFLGLLTVVLYNGLYTRLKKITILAIIPGGLVGAIPPVIGFTSAGGALMSPRILAFALFMFLWQLPHFWLILIKYGKDYSAAGFPNLTGFMNNYQIRILVFAWVLFSTVYLLVYFIAAVPVSHTLTVVLSVINISFIAVFYRLLFKRETSKEIRNAFILINSFSICVMLFLITFSILKGF
jgi:heme o synthase